ncbi:hypothetical protein IscW_ISCW011299 [Ixodes scapularis]|uniref:Uncharacterized protein n=1 Tax=Ixodes scapularis TaxID=6945 RepID=B7Q831_IXOSC|nr:hypothetical protein IscW_ISCW011299 [Ixodes scapularis]|eukprot:XP_002412270.1 hypothetical protein IscW_ISCW011299 [Ixodes scapularis]
MSDAKRDWQNGCTAWVQHLSVGLHDSNWRLVPLAESTADMAPDKKTKTQPSEGRRTTRSNSGSRLASTVVRDKSSSPSRGRSPKPSPPGKRQASRSRSRSQGRVGRPKGSSKSPGRKSSPGKVGRPKKSAKSPGRKPSPAKKSPKRKPSPVKKSPARSGARASSSDRGPVKSAAPKSPAKRADTPRAQSKSPSRPSMAGGRRSVSPAAKQHETNRKGAATPPRLPVGTPGQTVTPRSPLRRRSVPTPWAGAERPEPKGNSVLAEPRIQLDKSQVLYTPDRGRGALRTSARIATMQTTGADDRPDSGKLPEKGKSEKRFAAWESLKSFGWGPSLASLCWLLSLPLLALAVQLLSGNWALLPLPSVPKSLEAYLRWQLFAGYAGFLLAQALLQALPVGRTVYGFPSKVFKHHVAFKYRLNGWVNLLATAAAFGCLVYYGLSASALQLHSLQLLVTVLVTATLLSVLLYIKGRFASRNHRFPGGNTGNFDLHAGEYYLASVFVTEDALGYVTLVANLALLPLLSSLPARYLHEWRPTMPLYCLASIGAIFRVSHALPYTAVLLQALFLVVRVFEVEGKCRQRYGDLWLRYTQRVKYRLLPYVF